MDYITIADIDGKGYYQLNKNLFNNQYYQKKTKKIKTIKNKKVEVTTVKDTLSDTSKILYSILCDQLRRSLENGWWDEHKRVYVKFSIEKLAVLLNKSKDTIVACKKELEKNALIKIKDNGIGRADVFYIGKVKGRPVEDIEFELIDQTLSLKDNFDESVESFDWSKTSGKPVENVDSKPVENVDPINLLYKTNNKTSSSGEARRNSYEFLNKFELQPATKMFIRKNIHNLTEDLFVETYDKVKKELETGKIKDFEAVLYKALRGEWAFSKAVKDEVPTTEKIRKRVMKLYNYWVDSPYSPKEKLEKFNKDTANYPNEIVEEYKNKLIKFLKENGELIE
ncbi:replication initiator protein A [Fusobacterium varium]